MSCQLCLVVTVSYFANALIFVTLQAHSLLGDQSLNVVLRFLGTSPCSSDIIQTLQSVVAQIYYTYNWPFLPLNKMQTYGECRRVLWSTLEKVSKSRKHSPLLIVLDAVDQLVDTNNVFSMTWVPRYLPRNVFFVLSMLPDKYDCFNNTKQRIANTKSYIGLTTLDDTNALQIVESSLKHARRKLTMTQTDYVLTVFQKCKQPLFLKMIMDTAVTWHSYDKIDQAIIAQSVRGAISALFEGIENHFGKLFVRHALGYLTCGKGGLTSVEMEDALSCDDIVLNDVYRYHDPPLDDVVRIPSLMWSRVQNALCMYLVERQVDGKTVYTWYHRQFWEAADERYLSEREERRFLHSILADLFIQDNGIKRSILLENRRNRVMENADRCIAHQPLTTKNLRKLSALPYHLCQAGRLEELKSTCLYDFKWILTTLVAYDAYKLVKDFKNFEAFLPNTDKTLQLIIDFLVLVLDELSTDPLLLAFHIVERLGEFTESLPHINKLRNDAKEWLSSAPNPILNPSHSLELQKPGKSMIKSQILIGSTGKMTKSENILLCNQVEKISGDTKFNILSLESNEILASFASHKATFYETMNDDKRFAYIDFFQLKINELLSGDCLKVIRYEPEKYDKITIRCMAVSSDDLHIVIGAKLGRPSGIKQGDPKWSTQSVLYLIDVAKPESVIKTPFRSRKGMDTTFFILENKAILTTTRERITIFDGENLNIVNETEMKPRTLMSSTGVFIHGENKYAALTKCNKHINLVTYNVVNHELSVGKVVNLDSNCLWDPYTLKCNSQGNTFFAGCFSNDSAPVSTVCICDISADTTRIMTLTTLGFRAPSSVVIHPDWTHAFIGWEVGAITLIDLIHMTELNIFRSIGKSVSQMMISSNGTDLLTFEKDNTVKIWDVDLLLETKAVQLVTDNPNGHITEETKAATQETKLYGDIGMGKDANNSINFSQNVHLSVVHCLSFDVADDKLYIAGVNSRQGPKLFSLTDGAMCYDETLKLDALVQEANDKCNFHYDCGTNGEIRILDNGVMVYQRRLKGYVSIHVIDNSSPAPKLISSLGLDNAYVCLITNIPLPDDQDQSRYRICICRAAAVEIYDLSELSLLKTFPISPISNDIPNMESKTGKRKLKYQTCAVTYDGRYFICTNPAVLINEGVNKPLDVVDLRTGSSTRYSQPKHTVGINVLFDSFYYLFWEESGEPCLLPPSLYQHKRKDTPHYACLLQSVIEDFISRDHQFGVEFISRRHLVNWWRINPLEKVHTLRGHSLQVTTVKISTDSQFLVTGSNDKTVRLWDTRRGHQVAAFHFDGAIKNVRFDTLAHHVCVRYTAGTNIHKMVVLRFQRGKRQLRRRDTKALWDFT